MTIVRFRRFRTFDQMFSWKIMCVQCCNILASGENICAVHSRQSCQHYFASVYFFLRNNSSPLYTFQVFTATKLCFYFISINLIFGEYVTICIWASGANIFTLTKLVVISLHFILYMLWRITALHTFQK